MKIIITGASGMVGEGVLLECLQTADVTEVLVVGRRHCGHTHPKLREILHKDFMNLEPIEKQIAGFDACFFCLGVSSVGMNADEYKRMTYDLTLEMGRRLSKLSPNMTFTYVTGQGTDSSEQGRIRWARVKGATENELLRLFKNAYMFRPGVMTPVEGQKNLPRMFKLFQPLIPVIKFVAGGSVLTLNEVGRAMMNCARSKPSKHILEVADIKALGQK